MALLRPSRNRAIVTTRQSQGPSPECITYWGSWAPRRPRVGPN
jgi:hypothetical protein